MEQNAMVTAFTVSELLRENQQEGGLGLRGSCLNKKFQTKQFFYVWITFRLEKE